MIPPSQDVLLEETLAGLVDPIGGGEGCLVSLPAVSDCVVESVPLGLHVVSISRRTKFKRLHLTGACRLSPGVDYSDFEVLGPEFPHAAAFDARCKHCFRSQPILVPDVGMDSATSSGTSSESASDTDA